MKLRIRGNSIRLRLTQSEVARVGAGERLEEVLAFGPEPEQRLTYALEVVEESASITATYQAGRITLTLPGGVARAWATTDTVTLNAEQLNHDGTTLRLLIEKDFACLTDRRGADDADTFPHPLEGAVHC